MEQKTKESDDMKILNEQGITEFIDNPMVDMLRKKYGPDISFDPGFYFFQAGRIAGIRQERQRKKTGALEIDTRLTGILADLEKAEAVATELVDVYGWDRSHYENSDVNELLYHYEQHAAFVGIMYDYLGAAMEKIEDIRQKFVSE